MRFYNYLLASLLFSFFIIDNLHAQTSLRDLIESKRPDLEQIPPLNPLVPEWDIPVTLDLDNISEYGLYTLDDEVMSGRQQMDRKVIKLGLRLDNKPLLLEMIRTDLFNDNSRITRGSDGTIVDYIPGDHYWGIVKGQPNSVVALSIFEDRIEGSLTMNNKTYNIGKVDGYDYHILYRSDDVPFDHPECGVESLADDIGGTIENGSAPETSGATVGSVGVYYEVDHDIYLSKNSSITETMNFITAVLNEVALVYAAESINLFISEIKVWDIVDPYDNLSSSSTRLYAFRDALGGSYPGDLAHLLSFDGGGGIAYVNVLCNDFYGVGYSGIYSTYSAYPAYSWTVMVIAHELGHNFGSPHTHACAWNGNNTPIDGCGPQAGYPDSGCSVAGPIPAKGTVMSYCHLLSGVGIDLELGFGQQPGDLIRSRTINATCLNNCVVSTSCDDGDPCTTNDTYDANCNCSGTLLSDTDGDGVCDAQDICPGGDDNLDSDQDGVPDFCDDCDNTLAGTSCNDNNLCTINDVYDANCNCLGILQDSDNDGVCDGNDQCPGGDDTIDTNGNGIPDACESECVIQSTTFPQDPLIHSGSGSSSTILVLSKGTKDVEFTVSNIDARTNGKGTNRYIEIVQVIYTDGVGNSYNYGQFNGADVSSALVSFAGIVQSVEVILLDGYDGNTSTQMGVDIGAVTICSTPCQDSDGDGVCDGDDVCPGSDDNLDSDNDGVPNGCDDCINIVTDFPIDPLTHSGAGSSSVSVTLSNQSDIFFTISQLGSKINGKPDNRFSELVLIEYKTDNTTTYQNYGTFSGSNQKTVNVNISGAVTEVRVTLSDELGGNNELSINLSSVSGCLDAVQSLSPGKIEIGKSLKAPKLIAFPNPFVEDFTVELTNHSTLNNGRIMVMDNYGRRIYDTRVKSGQFIRKIINSSDWVPGVYYIQYIDSEIQMSKMLIKVD